MHPAERSTLSFTEVAIRMLLPALIGGVIVYAMMQYSTKSGGDRPPIIISDGSIRIDEVATGGSTSYNGKGKFARDGANGDRPIWKHEHGAGAPKRLHVLVEGSTSCGALYFVQDITTATLEYSYTGGTRTVAISRNNQGDVLFDVAKDADVQQTSGTHTLLIDEGSGADLTGVTFTWGMGGNAGTATCQFAASPAPRLTLLQTTK